MNHMTDPNLIPFKISKKHSLPGHIVGAIKRHFHWVNPDKMEDILYRFIDSNEGKTMLIFDLHSELHGFVRRKCQRTY